MTSTPAIQDYHRRTVHRRDEVPPARRVDPALVPRRYKRYTGLPSMPLPEPSVSHERPGLPLLSALLHYSNGVIRRRNINGRELEFRAASCTGALHHVEVYVVSGPLEGLDAGVYHYDALAEALRPLRPGDHRGMLSRFCAYEGLALSPFSLILTSTFWRNAWRYEDRAYRHVFWDAGTIVANLLALAEQHSLQPRLFCGFVDDSVDTLIGVDGRHEASVCVVSFTGGAATPDSALSSPVELAPLALATEPLSRAEIEYPMIWRTHKASMLPDIEAVEAWRASVSGAPAAAADFRLDDAAAVIERRGSARRFSRAAISHDHLTSILAAANSRIESDFSPLSQAYVLVHRAEGLDAGVYVAGSGGSLILMQAGDLSDEATRLALDQPLAGDAAFNLYFVADLDALEDTPAGRGYRAAQLEAGIRSGRVYLEATRLGLRATGLTFYDDEVARVLGLDEQSTAVLMLMAVGR